MKEKENLNFQISQMNLVIHEMLADTIRAQQKTIYDGWTRRITRPPFVDLFLPWLSLAGLKMLWKELEPNSKLLDHNFLVVSEKEIPDRIAF